MNQDIEALPLRKAMKNDTNVEKREKWCKRIYTASTYINKWHRKLIFHRIRHKPIISDDKHSSARSSFIILETFPWDFVVLQQIIIPLTLPRCPIFLHRALPLPAGGDKRFHVFFRFHWFPTFVEALLTRRSSLSL